MRNGQWIGSVVVSSMEVTETTVWKCGDGSPMEWDEEKKDYI